MLISSLLSSFFMTHTSTPHSCLDRYFHGTIDLDSSQSQNSPVTGSKINTLPKDVEIFSLHCHSKQVKESSVFVALEENTSIRQTHIQEAIENGAILILCSLEDETWWYQNTFSPILPLFSSCPRRDYALLSASFFGHPANALSLIAVTGTNGKTTTTHLIKEMLESLGHKVGLIGTNENVVGNTHYSSQRTTPDAYQLHGLLKKMMTEHCTHVVMEVSSHGLVQHRTAGLAFDVGIFTNLTQDHLDYHETMDAYKEAKARLFLQSHCSIYNIDDPIGVELSLRDTADSLTYSQHQKSATLCSDNAIFSTTGISFLAVHGSQSAPLSLGIPGTFSLYNALATLTCGLALGYPLATLCPHFSTMKGVKGRVEVVPTPCDFTVMIDYAHTPDALDNVLSMAKQLTTGRIICLFGCGGNRDQSKRPLMAKVAEQWADILVITSDNPRFEDPEHILSHIVHGLSPSLLQENQRLKIIPNRKEGIFTALSLGTSGDLVILAGKGHECYQEIQGEHLPFDERQIVSEYFSKMD